MKIRYAMSALCIMASAGLVGCGDDEETDGQSGNNTAEKAQALLGPIHDALENPTGTLDDVSAPNVFAALLNQETAGEAAAYVPGAAPPPSSPQADSPATCVEANGAGGTMDMDCLTGGAVTGTLTYQASGTGNPIYVVYSYDDVCVVEADTCMNGDGAQEVSGDLQGGVYDVILAGDFTVTSAGESFSLQYGYKLSVDGQTITLEYVVFTDDGNSYTVSISTDGTASTWSITGANGSFECTTTDGGATGTCTGAGDFSW